jgi:hypothetical protein
MRGASEAEGMQAGVRGEQRGPSGEGGSTRKGIEAVQEEAGGREPGARQGETRHAVEHWRGAQWGYGRLS